MSPAEAASGQDLIFHGRFSAAHLYFDGLSVDRPNDPVGPTLAAAALIWWAEARDEETWLADSVDALLETGARRAAALADAAPEAAERARALFWQGTALSYRARQAELRGRPWRAAREAGRARRALEEALSLDPDCVDCLLGLAVFDYALARMGAIPRLVARLAGLGGGDAERAMAMFRRVAESGTLSRVEGRWFFANALARDGERDPALREEAWRIVAGLVEEYPDNPVFRRFLAAVPAP